MIIKLIAIYYIYNIIFIKSGLGKYHSYVR
nr:MAG TPA: hypothetical protein [Caudoviricetes sp.]